MKLKNIVITLLAIALTIFGTIFAADGSGNGDPELRRAHDRELRAHAAERRKRCHDDSNNQAAKRGRDADAQDVSEACSAVVPDNGGVGAVVVEADKCSICLEVFDVTPVILFSRAVINAVRAKPNDMTPCHLSCSEKHKFHSACIVRAYNANCRACPMCRIPFRVDALPLFFNELRVAISRDDFLATDTIFSTVRQLHNNTEAQRGAVMNLVDARNELNLTPLMLAAQYNRVAAIKAILMNLRSRYDYTLSTAMMRVAMMSVIDAQDDVGATPLMLAAERGNVEAIDAIFSAIRLAYDDNTGLQHAAVMSVISARSMDGLTPLAVAAGYDRAEAMKAIFAAIREEHLDNADARSAAIMDAINTKDNEGATLLMYAAWLGNLGAINAIFNAIRAEFVADADAEALRIAARGSLMEFSGDVSALCVAVRTTLNAEAPDRRTAFDFARNAATRRLLIDHGAACGIAVQSQAGALRGRCALLARAALTNNTDVIKAIFAAIRTEHADDVIARRVAIMDIIKPQFSDYWPPLMIAADGACVAAMNSIFDAIRAAYADNVEARRAAIMSVINAQDSDGKTALMKAVTWGGLGPMNAIFSAIRMEYEGDASALRAAFQTALTVQDNYHKTALDVVYVAVIKKRLLAIYQEFGIPIPDAVG